MATETEQAVCCTVSAEALYAALDQCQIQMASARDGRPVLQGIHVKSTGDRVAFTATDGYALVSVRIPVSAGVWEGIIDRDSVKAALAAIKADRRARGALTRPATLTLEPAGWTLSLDDVTLPLLARDGSFPHYDQLIPPMDRMTGSHAAFNGALIGDIFKAAGKYAHPKGAVRLYMPAQPSQPCRMEWESDDDSWSATAVVMPMFVTW